MLGGARGLATITTSRVEIPRPDPGRPGQWPARNRAMQTNSNAR